VGLERCRVLEFPKVSNPAGNLTFIEEARHVPFEIRRVFYVYDIPSGGFRGAHAHKTLEEVLICLSGGFEVYLDDAYQKRNVRLNRPWLGLYIPPMTWISQADFDPATVYVVLASDFYDEADYYRDYEAFRQAVRGQGG
jgi:oxalate decarboxylase/phosphoglucose isomerase-like protein (cupin superfamily)